MLAVSVTRSVFIYGLRGVLVCVELSAHQDLPAEKVSKLTSTFLLLWGVCNILILIGKTGSNLGKWEPAKCCSGKKGDEGILPDLGELCRSKCYRGKWKIITADPGRKWCGKHWMCSLQEPSSSGGMWRPLLWLGFAILLHWQDPKCGSWFPDVRTEQNICLKNAFQEEKGVSGSIPCFLPVTCCLSECNLSVL